MEKYNKFSICVNSCHFGECSVMPKYPYTDWIMCELSWPEDSYFQIKSSCMQTLANVVDVIKAVSIHIQAVLYK